VSKTTQYLTINDRHLHTSTYILSWGGGRRDSVVGTVTRLRVGHTGFESWRRQEILRFFRSSRPAVGPTQPPVQWVPVFLGIVTRPGRDVDRSPPTSSEVKNEWNYTTIPPTCLPGAGRGISTFFLASLVFLRKGSRIVRLACNCRTATGSLNISDRQ
jgi:hypothetical protein